MAAEGDKRGFAVMTPERWQEITEMLNEILRIPPQQRAERLEEISLHDSELHRELVSLIVAHESAARTPRTSRVVRLPSGCRKKP